jgi:hypothetical protein
MDHTSQVGSSGSSYALLLHHPFLLGLPQAWIQQRSMMH